MKTCFNCGNNADPRNSVGQKVIDRLGGDGLSFHPLDHFGFCVKRRQWLDIARRNCGNWTDPCKRDLNHIHLPLPPKLAKVAVKARPHRYRIAAALYSVALAAALLATDWMAG